MTNEAIQQLIGVIAAISGVIIGASVTYIFNYRLKKLEIQHNSDQELRVQKRLCCTNFISEANRLVVHAMREKISSPNEFVTLTTYFTNIELLCSKTTVKAALSIFNMVLSLHEQVDKKTETTYAELRKILISEIKEEINNKI